jgi:hypothetical protein
MTTVGRSEKSFNDVTRMRQIGTRYFALGGETETVPVSTLSSGLVSLIATPVALGAVPRDVASDGAELFILTGAGLQVATLANTPVLGDHFEFDPGDGEWLFCLDGKIIAPVKHGVQSIDADDGVEASSFPGMASCIAAALSSDDLLYVVDQVRCKIFVFRVIAGVPNFVDSFRANNCREVVKVELDEDEEILYVVCRKRIVLFDVPNDSVEDDEVTVSFNSETRATDGDFTDLQVVPGGVWIGVDADTDMNPLDNFSGPQFAVYDSGNDILVVASPALSLLSTTDVIPSTVL